MKASPSRKSAAIPPPSIDLAAALDALKGSQRILVCPHDDPDPDALAASWGMALLLERELPVEITVAFEGIIGRAENRAMVRELNLKLRRRELLDLDSFDGVFFVDTQPASGNHSVPSHLKVLGCVDHHPLMGELGPIPWLDIEPNGGTSSSIVLTYLISRKIPLSPDLATAIVYAIKTDTRDLSRDATLLDIQAHEYAFERADLRALGAIINPKLHSHYFENLFLALKVARVHDHSVVVFLPTLDYPDLTAEMADLFVRRQQTRWCLCAGIYRQTLRFSLRCEDHSLNAGQLAARLIAPRGGSAGGHDMIAGGEIPLDPHGPSPELDSLWSLLARDFLTAVQAPASGQPLYRIE
ncbi:MAG: hypothetical protein JW797_14500 [Bradymonadales bacterium]|nr:hypothetical protein [Bradymonadales bacterium]